MNKERKKGIKKERKKDTEKREESREKRDTEREKERKRCREVERVRSLVFIVSSKRLTHCGEKRVLRFLEERTIEVDVVVTPCLFSCL